MWRTAFCFWSGLSAFRILHDFNFTSLSSFNSKFASYFFCISFFVWLFFAFAIPVAKTSYFLLLPDLYERLFRHLGRLPVYRYPLCDYKITYPGRIFNMEWFIKRKAVLRTKHRIITERSIFDWHEGKGSDRIKLLGGQLAAHFFICVSRFAWLLPASHCRFPERRFSVSVLPGRFREYWWCRKCR